MSPAPTLRSRRVCLGGSVVAADLQYVDGQGWQRRPHGSVVGESVADHGDALILPAAFDLSLAVPTRPSPEERDAAFILGQALAGGVTGALMHADVDDESADSLDDADDVVGALHRACSNTQVASPFAAHFAAQLLRAPGRANAPGAAGALVASREPADMHRATAAGGVAFVDAAVSNPRACAPTDSELLRRALELCRTVGGLAVLSPVDGGLRRGAIAVEGPVATRLGLPAAPLGTAEAIGVGRAVALARLTGARIHLTGLSTALGLKAVEAAVADGVEVSADVAPWSILVDDETWCRRPYDTALCVWPPLPRPADREAMLDAVQRGVVVVAAHHRCVPARRKALEVDGAMPGAMTFAALLPTLAAVLTPTALVQAVSAGPRRILGGLGVSPEATGTADTPDTPDTTDLVVLGAADGTIAGGLLAGCATTGAIDAVWQHNHIATTGPGAASSSTENA